MAGKPGRIISLVVAAAGVLSSLGCYPHIYKDRPNPFKDIKVFAVAPIAGLKDFNIPKSSEALEDVFADELASFEGVDSVIRLRTVAATMEKLGLARLTTAEEALKVLREVKADALIAMEVMNVNLMPHDVRVTMALQLFTVRKFDPRSIDWKSIEVSPRPFALPEEFGRRPIAGFQKTYVTSNKDTHKKIMVYAAAHDTSERGLGPEVYTKVFREFFRFVSYDMIIEIWEREYKRLEKQKETLKPVEGDLE